MEITWNNIYNMDCLPGLKMLSDNSIDMVVTSPPYDNLRQYGNGKNWWGEHIWKPIIEQLYRVVRKGGCVVWIVSDEVIKGSESGSSFKQALYFISCGFNLHDTMIWQKDSSLLPDKIRYGQSFEYMFVFSKGKPSVVNKLSLIHI